MKALLNAYAWRRARRLATWITPLLPATGRLLDVGSGTGHNGAVLRESGLHVTDTDVVDLHVVGPAPVRCHDGHLPFDDDAFDVALLLYVLHYADDAADLLREAARVSPRIVLLQSTYRGALGRRWLASRELLTGRLAFRVARALRFVSSPTCPMDAPHPMTRDTLAKAIQQAGLRVARSAAIGGGFVSRDLMVLERAT